VLENIIAPALFAVPRVLSPSKPFFRDAGMVVFKENIGEDESVGFAIGVFGSAYIISGPVAILALLFAYGFILSRLYRRLNPLAGTFGGVFCYSACLWIAFMFLRFGTIGFTAIYVYQRMLPAIALAVFLLLTELKLSVAINRPGLGSGVEGIKV
jgi:hypothetical protein